MDYLLLFLGIIIVLVTIWDLINTTFSPDGAGFFTMTVTKTVYNTFRKVCLKFNWMKSFESAGIVIIALIIIFWYLSIWIGSTLIICSDPQSVIHAQSREYATAAEKMYYTGFTLTTLGIGDFNPASTRWRFFTVLLSLTGFILITTGISYMVPALSAVVTKRKLGSYISFFGTTPQAILKDFWESENFEGLEPYFNTLTELIIEHNQQMLAYPVIYCFHTSDSKKSAVLNIVRLDEALSIILKLIPEEKSPSRKSLNSLRNAITDYIVTQQKHFIKLESEEPPLPNMNQITEAGIPIIYDRSALSEAFMELSDRRKCLRSLLKDQGKDFDNVYQEEARMRLSV